MSTDPPAVTEALEELMEPFLQIAGVFGALGLIIAPVAYLLSPPMRRNPAEPVVIMLMSCVMLLAYLTSSAAPDLDWATLARVLGGAVLAAGAGGGAYLGRSLPRRAWQGLRRGWSARRARAAEHAEQTRAEKEYLAELTGRHDRVREAWASYQLDLEAFLAAPALADIAVEHTAAFVLAMSRTQDRRPGAAGRPDHYGEAVYALESAWETARAHARRAGADYLTAPQRFDRAAGLLRLAHGEHEGGAHERQQALDKAHKLLSPLVSPPEPLHQELDHRVRATLEA